MVGNQNLTKPAVESQNVVYTVNIKPVYEAHDLCVFKSKESALKKFKREFERHCERFTDLSEIQFAIEIQMEEIENALDFNSTAKYDTWGGDANRIIIEIEKHTLWG